MNPPVHETGAKGFAQAAEAYVRGRPDYPPEVVTWLRDVLALKPGKRVVDLAAGTGKFTPNVVQTGAEVLAIEPVAEMRAQFSRLLPDVRVMDGTADSLPLPDASVDAVVTAQAFHWFAAASALSEIHRVLRPGGQLGLVWNLRDDSVPWVAALGDVVQRRRGTTPSQTTGAWRNVFPFPGFGPLRETRFKHSHVGPAAEVIVNRVLSTSFVATLPKSERAHVTRELRAVMAAESALRDRDVVEVPYETLVVAIAKDP